MLRANTKIGGYSSYLLIIYRARRPMRLAGYSKPRVHKMEIGTIFLPSGLTSHPPLITALLNLKVLHAFEDVGPKERTG